MGFLQKKNSSCIQDLKSPYRVIINLKIIEEKYVVGTVFMFSLAVIYEDLRYIEEQCSNLFLLNNWECNIH